MIHGAKEDHTLRRPGESSPVGGIRGEGGYAFLTVIFGLVMLSALAVAALNISGDEWQSGQAIRTSGAAFYAAESGMNREWSRVEDYELDTLSANNTLDLGWQDRGDGSSYRATITRLDDGTSETPIFVLEVEGRPPPGSVEGARRVTAHFTRMDASLKFDGAVKARGNISMDSNTQFDGHDHEPPQWSDDAGEDRCEGITPEDQTGLMIEEDADLDIRGDSYDDGEPLTRDGHTYIDGSPALEEDPMIDDAAFDSFGDLAWDELKATADHVIGCEGCGKLRFEPRATTRIDADGNVVCDTSDPYNWGSSDPTHPCYNYFPVIRVVGDGAYISDGDNYAQAVVLPDGAEFDVEDNMNLMGLLLSRGCLEIDSNIYGAVIHDEYDGSGCSAGENGIYMDDPGATVHFSSCAVQRALENSAANLILGSSWDLMAERSFHQPLR